MSKTIRMELSYASIKNAINEIQMYKKSLDFKLSTFVQRLTEAGLKTANNHKVARGDADFDGTECYVEIDSTKSPIRATLVLHGKDAAFIEFGAGVYYNGAGGTSPNPYGQSLGMVIGSYGQGHGLEDSWWHDGKMTHGTEAAMPMYLADQEIIKNFYNIAKEVFENE